MNRQSLRRKVNTDTGQAPKKNKFGAKKAEFNGITFDSQAERNMYLLLLSKQQAGEISEIELQPQFILQEKYRNAEGKARAAITYKADFRVTYSDGRVEVIDVKGHPSRDFSLRMRMFEKRYGMALTVVKPEDIPKMR